MIDVGTNGGPNTDYPSASAISNYTYEDRLQEQKRQIRLIQPRFIDDFVKDFERKMNESLKWPNYLKTNYNLLVNF